MTLRGGGRKIGETNEPGICLSKRREQFMKRGMRKLATIIAFISLATGRVLADEGKTNSTGKTETQLKIKAAEAKDHIGTNAVVSGTIADVYKGRSTINLNFDQPYPKQTFTAVIFAANTNQFPEIEKLKGKRVEVSGKIVTYQERPQIVVTSTNQLKVIEKEGDEKE